MPSDRSTEDALHDAIKKLTEQTMASNALVGEKARVIKTLSLAYRYTSGGPQPGSDVVEK